MVIRTGSRAPRERAVHRLEQECRNSLDPPISSRRSLIRLMP